MTSNHSCEKPELNAKRDRQELFCQRSKTLLLLADISTLASTLLRLIDNLSILPLLALGRATGSLAILRLLPALTLR